MNGRGTPGGRFEEGDEGDEGNVVRKALWRLEVIEEVQRMHSA